MAREDEQKMERLSLYDFFGFPERQARDEAREVFEMDRLQLISVDNSDLWFSDTFFEQYRVWSNHINNFSFHLCLHLLLMYYQYKQNPLNIIDISKLQSPQGAHKIYFDTFAEDASLYLISWFYAHTGLDIYLAK